MRSHAPLLLLTLAVVSWVSPALADAVDDSPCQRWEHWEGGHDGRCVAGPRCSVVPGAAAANGPSAVAILAVAAILLGRRRRRAASPSLRGALALLAVALVPATAAADVVFPLECPPGLDVRGHHERDCWPRTCTSDSQCGAGASCRQVSRCIETRQIHEGDSMDTIARDADDGPCGAGNACTAGGTCRQLSRCEPTEATPSFVNGRWTTEPYVPPSSMCAASVPASRGGTLPGVWLVALALLSWRTICSRTDRGR